MGWLMHMEQFVERELTGETEIRKENLLQYHFVYQKLRINWPGIKPQTLLWEIGLSYGTNLVGCRS
jgi:hypothetical protein